MIGKYLKIVETLGRRFNGGEEDEFWVRGSGLIPVPKGQVNEIPNVIRDHHNSELELEKLRAMLRNGSWVRRGD